MSSKRTFRYIVYKINPHKRNLCSHVGNLTQSGMWMWLISSPHFASQASKTSHPGNSKPSQTVTLNKAVFLKYGFRMKLWYTKWGDIDLAVDPTGPQAIDKMKSVVMLDCSGAVRLYHVLVIWVSAIYSCLSPLPFCKDLILFKESVYRGLTKHNCERVL